MATKIRRIMVTLSESVLKDVEWLAPLEDMTRDELISTAIRRFLKPHLEIRTRVSKAAANPGRTYGPFDTHAEFVASLRKEAARKRRLRSKKP